MQEKTIYADEDAFSDNLWLYQFDDGSLNIKLSNTQWHDAKPVINGWSPTFKQVKALRDALSKHIYDVECDMFQHAQERAEEGEW